MPHLNREIKSAGPLISGRIGVSDARQQALLNAGEPVPSSVEILALIDTGASHTCIDPGVIEALEIETKGNVPVGVPGGRAAFETCDAALYIPVENQPSFAFENIPVMKVPLLQEHGFHVLIGRDVLEKCILIYNGGTKTFTLAY